MRIINPRLLSHPLNWLTVWSMALIVFYLAHLITSYFEDRHPGVMPSQSTTKDAAGPGTDVPESAFA
jgi:hypothetical protein